MADLKIIEPKQKSSVDLAIDEARRLAPKMDAVFVMAMNKDGTIGLVSSPMPIQTMHFLANFLQAQVLHQFHNVTKGPQL